MKSFFAGPTHSLQEVTFVPRHANAEEGDGWLIVPVSRVSKMRSDLVILDAQKVAAGPVATLRIPVRVRATFHGTWVPEAALKSGRFNYKRVNRA